MQLFDPNRPTRILTLSGDEEVTAAIRASLGAWKTVPHECEYSTTVEQAVAMISASAPDIVLLDYGSAEQSGLLRLDRLRDARPEIPIIMVSRHGDEQWAVHAMQAGASDHLPFAELNLLLRSAVGLAIERVRALRELERLNDNLVGIVSHDVRAPAANIVGYTDILLEPGRGSDLLASQRKMLVRIRENARFILSLAHDLLDTVRISSGSLELVSGRHDVGSLIVECMERCRVLSDCNGVSMRSSCPPGEIFAIFDRPKMLQVLINLASNALKFSSEGSAVDFGASQTEGETVIRVADRGQGIPSDEIERLFKKFSLTSTRPLRGERTTGLGLYIVSEFVKLHRGSLIVDSVPGVGSTFSIRLPRSGQLAQIAA